MQAVADPSLAALAESMAGKKSESISTTAKSDAMPSHGSAASSCSASPAAQTSASSVPAPTPAAPVTTNITKQKHAISPKQKKTKQESSTKPGPEAAPAAMPKDAEPIVVTPAKKSKKLEAETAEKKKKKMKKRGRASSVPDKPSKPLPEGFSGATSRSGHCWVCGHEREQHQKGSVCTLCYAHGRKLLKHQRLSELRENPELLERVQQMSAEVREQRQSKKGKTSKREDLMARFEEAMKMLPQLEDLLKRTSSAV